MKNTLKNNNGFSLIEAVIAVVIMSVIMFSLVSLFQVATNSLVKTRSQIKDTRLGQMIFSKLKTIDYYMLFDINSSSPNFGLNGTFGNVSAQSPT